MNVSIEVNQLSKQFRGAHRAALQNVSFSIEAGEIFGVVGPNGAGKTTLFGCLLGHLHFEGSVKVGGWDPRDPRGRREFGYVPERLNFETWMTAQAFVGFHYDLSGQPKTNKAGAVTAALEKVGIESIDWTKQIAKFSRGNLQRLALAQAIVGKPRYLFLDEPTSGMDPLGVFRFKEIARELAADGCTVIFNSHQLAQVQDLCQRVLFLEKGELLRIEKLKLGAPTDGSLQERLPFAIRWLGPKDAEQRVKKIADKLKLSIVRKNAEEAILTVKDEMQASQVLALLVRAGVKIAHAGIQIKDLEHEFNQAYGRKP